MLLFILLFGLITFIYNINNGFSNFHALLMTILELNLISVLLMLSNIVITSTTSIQKKY